MIHDLKTILHLVLVEHQRDGKRYVFDCTNLKDVIKAGDTVICETMRGEQTGTAVIDPIRVEGARSYIASFLRLTGAYFPLKQIIGIQRQQELTEDDKERIAKEWLRKRIGSNELPF